MWDVVEEESWVLACTFPITFGHQPSISKSIGISRSFSISISISVHVHYYPQTPAQEPDIKAACANGYTFNNEVQIQMPIIINLTCASELPHIPSNFRLKTTHFG